MSKIRLLNGFGSNDIGQVRRVGAENNQTASSASPAPTCSISSFVPSGVQIRSKIEEIGWDVDALTSYLVSVRNQAMAAASKSSPAPQDVRLTP